MMSTAGTPNSAYKSMPHQGTIMMSRNTVPAIPSTSSLGGQSGPLLYAVPAPRSLGRDLLCLCRKVYWMGGTLMYCAYTPVTKEEAALLLKDPSVINILSNPVSGTNLLTVAANGAIVGVQQTVGYINTSGAVSKELKARPKKSTLVTPSSVSPNEAEKAPAISPAMPRATATPATVVKNIQCEKPVVSTSSCTSMLPKIESVFTLADTSITTNSLLQNVADEINTKEPEVPNVSTSQHVSSGVQMMSMTAPKQGISNTTSKIDVNNDLVQPMKDAKDDSVPGKVMQNKDNLFGTNHKTCSSIAESTTSVCIKNGISSVPNMIKDPTTASSSPCNTPCGQGQQVVKENVSTLSLKVPAQNIRNIQEATLSSMPPQNIPISQVTELTTDKNLHSASTLLKQFINAKMQNLPNRVPPTCIKMFTPDMLINGSKICVQTSKKKVSSITPPQTETKLSSVLPSLRVPPFVANVISKPDSLPIVVHFKKPTSEILDVHKMKETNIKGFDFDRPTIETKAIADSSDSAVKNLSSTIVASDVFRKAAADKELAQTTNLRNVGIDSSSFYSSKVDQQSPVKVDQKSTEKVDQKSPTKVHLNVSAELAQTILPKKVPQNIQPAESASPPMKVQAAVEPEQDEMSTDLAPKEIVQHPLQQEDFMTRSTQQFSESTNELLGKVHNVLTNVQNTVNNNNSEDPFQDAMVLDTQSEQLFFKSTDKLMGKVHNVQNRVNNNNNNNTKLLAQEKEHDHISSDIKDEGTLQDDTQSRLHVMSTRGTKRKSDESDSFVGKGKRTASYSNQLTSESLSETNIKLKVKFRFNQKSKGSKHSTCSNSPSEEHFSDASKDLEEHSAYSNPPTEQNSSEASNNLETNSVCSNSPPEQNSFEASSDLETNSTCSNSPPEQHSFEASSNLETDSACSNSQPGQKSSETSEDLVPNTVHFPDGPLTVNNPHGFKFTFDPETRLSAVDGIIPKLKPLKKLTAADAMALGCNHSKTCRLAPDGTISSKPEEKVIYEPEKTCHLASDSTTADKPDSTTSSTPDEKVIYEPEKASTLVALTKNPDFSHIPSGDRVAYLKELQRMQRAALGMT